MITLEGHVSKPVVAMDAHGDALVVFTHASGAAGGVLSAGSPVTVARPLRATRIPPVPERPSVVFVRGRPLVTWQELAYAGSGRDGDCCAGDVSLEYATGSSLATLSPGRLLLPTALGTDASGALPGTILAGGANGRVYEIFALSNGTVRASRLIDAG